MRARIMKKRHMAIIMPLLYVALMVGMSFLSSDSTYAVSDWQKQACAWPINTNHSSSNPYTVFMVVNSSIADNFDGLAGGSDNGVHWACYDEIRSDGTFIQSGIMFIASSITKSDPTPTYSGSTYKYPIYTINTDVNISGGTGTTAAILSGMVHYGSETSANNAADHIGICRKQSDCQANSNGTAKPGAEGKQADGIFSGFPTSMTRQESGETDKAQSSFGHWSPPNHTKSITINNATLIDAIKNDSNLSVSSDAFRNAVKAGTGASGWVRFYIHRCWAGDDTGCRTSPLYLLVNIPTISNPTNFDGKISVTSVSTGTLVGTTYKTDDTSATASFKYEMKRKDGESTAKETWKAYYDKTSLSGLTDSTSADKTETNETFSNTEWKQVHTHTSASGAIKLPNEGSTDKYCEVLAFYKKSDNGTLSDFTNGTDAKQACVNFYRYVWNTVSAQVVPSSTNAAVASDGIYYTDGNTADIKFAHQMKSNNSSGVKPTYKTSKTSNLGDSFPTVANYTMSGTAVGTSFTTIYNSPNSGTATVNVPKDTGDTFKQTITYYKKTREDSASGKYGGGTDSATGEITIKRYKTTFSGSSKIYVNSSNIVDENGAAVDSTTNVAGKTLRVVNVTSYPAGIPITFKHTVTRSNSDAHGSPNTKSVSLKTEITKSDDIRSDDPHGTAINKTVGPLAAGGSATEPDSFTVQVYPEHSIKLCQQMTYTNEIQGADATTAKASEACVTIVMSEATCLGDKTFGIKNGKNWLKAEIYKNNASEVSKTTDVLYQGNTHSIVEWAKPGDQIRYKYYGCAGGELARQYKNADTHTTSYTISTDTAGYLFGNTVGLDSNGTYNATSTTVGSSSTTDGTGPFASGSFTITVGSPNGSGLYTCTYYGSTNSISNFYRIPAYISGVSESNYRDNCKSDDTGRVSDLGHTITQYASWTDIQYSSGSVVSGHDGSSTAKVTAQVKVPYNYNTDISTSGTGGYIHPGTTHTENVRLTVVDRQNELVNGSTEYSTTTKPSKYRLIQIIVGNDHTGSSTDFNNLVNGDSLFADDNGSKNLATDLEVCKSFNCQIVSSGDNKQYDSRNNGTNGQTIGSYELSVPYNVDPGVKYCYFAAIWPSDSHNDPSKTSITAADNEVALKTGAIAGSKWHVSGATCFTTAKRPNIHILGGDVYAQRYITGHTTKYPEDASGTNPRIYGSWAEYGLVAGKSVQGFASGASLWGGSNNVSNKPNANVNCIYSALTYANAECDTNKLGSMAIDTMASSSPKNLTDQIKTRYTRSSSEAYTITKSDPTIPVSNDGTCVLNGNKFEKNPTNGPFTCIGDSGAKYIHVGNGGAQTASIQSTFCLSKGDADNNHITVVHSNGTLVIGANVLYGSGSGCAPETYADLNELPQYIFIAKKIVIKEEVTHIDGWLVADEVITCDPGDDWEGTVAQSEINSKNCNQQLTINGPVLTKNIKLYRTFGASFEGGTYLASPSEIFKMGADVYLWSFNQASRYSQATTTYARELAPRY